MSELTSSALLLLALFLLLASGYWIGIALTAVGVLGMLLTDRPVASLVAGKLWSTSTEWSLTALPLFIWMGEILLRSRLSEAMFRSLAPWMRGLPGGLLHTNILGCTIFAAISGSSAATTATIGSMTIPELRKRGYPEQMVVGTLAGAGTMGLLIPPSIMMIVYGVTANVSIGKLFIAGIVPGILLALMFSAYVCMFSHRHQAPRDHTDEHRLTFMEKLRESRHLIPVLVLIVLVLGSIYGGFATATEAAVLGVLGALLLCMLQGALSWKTFQEGLLGAIRLSCMIGLVLLGASVLTLAMGFTGIPRAIAGWIAASGLSVYGLILALLVFYIILGCLVDGISMIVLTMAVVLPTIQQSGIDLIWFGVFVVLTVEMAQITPPVGFNLFVLQGITGHQITYLARAALPYFLLMVLLVATITVFPEIVLFLPEKMIG